MAVAILCETNLPVLQFDCSSDVTLMELLLSLLLMSLDLQDEYICKRTDLQEQYFIMKPKETITRSFKLYPGTDQAAKYVCAGTICQNDD